AEATQSAEMSATEIADLSAALEDVQAQATVVAGALPPQEATEEGIAAGEPGMVAPDVAAVAEVTGIDAARLSLVVDESGLMVEMSNQPDTVQNVPLDGYYTDLIARTTLTLNTADVTDYCGFAFRREDTDSYYTAEITREGEARFFVRYLGEWSRLATVDTDAINTNPGDSNTMTIVVEGNAFTMFVNGEELLDITDNRLTEGAVTLLGGTLADNDDTACNFENVTVYALGEIGAAADETDAVVESSENGTTYAGVTAARTEDGAFILGNPDAPVTVVQFADFRCPACQNYRLVIDEFIENEVLTGRARFEFRMLPTVDQEAVAFRAIECAVSEDTPADFWPFHDVMYDIATETRDPNLLLDDFVRASGIDETAFEDCFSTADQYITDQSIARSVGATGTPAMYFYTDNTSLFPVLPGQPSGGVPPEVLAALVATYN
ncbi:MAG: thioredoxin domain-containing protein, partial [Chloroflexota bacterium]